MAPDPHHVQRQLIASRMNDRDMTNEQIADMVGVKVRTIQRWRQQGFDGRDERGRPIEHDISLIAPLLRDYIRDHNDTIQKELRDHLTDEYGLAVSRQTVGRILKKDDITNKKLVYSYGECTQQATDSFKQTVQQFNGTLLDRADCPFVIWQRVEISV